MAMRNSVAAAFSGPARPSRARRPMRARPVLERLEARCTPAAASAVADILPGAGASVPANFVNVNGTLFFTADDGSHGRRAVEERRHGRRHRPGQGHLPGLQRRRTTRRPQLPDQRQRDAVLRGRRRHPRRRSCGRATAPPPAPCWSRTSTRQRPAHGLEQPDERQRHAVLRGRRRHARHELWKSDGTAAGTVLVKDISPGSAGSIPNNLTNVNGTLFFAADDGTNGTELWKSDGTAAGTVLVKDIRPSCSGSSYPGYLTNVNGTLFFAADDGTHGRELWKSDGTAAGTVLVKDINPGIGTDSYPTDLTNVNGTLFFTADDGAPAGAVEERRHRRRHRPGQGHHPGGNGSTPAT